MKRIIGIITLLILAVFLPGTGRAQETVTLQAEDGLFNGSPSTSIPGYTGMGYVRITDPNTPTVNWNFSTTNPGTYRLTIRFNTPHGEKGFDGIMNGQGFSGMFAYTASSWADFDAGLFELVESQNTLQIGGGWHWYNIDKVTFTPAAPPEPPLPVPPTLTDPQATFAARMLMTRLAEDYGTVTWAGQNEPYEDDLNYIQNRSGQLPAFIEGDLMRYSPSRVERGDTPTITTEEYIDLDDYGYVFGLCWHWNAPTNLVDSGEWPWWRGFYTQATTFDVEAALADTNSTEYALILRDIDAIAVQLHKTSYAGIPVLWRPLHEASGGWFWWGAKGPEPFKELWRLLYQRLTDHHDLHNLIWVLTNEDPAWHPGDDVVDIVGVDAYPDDPADTLQSRWQAMLSQFDGNKLITLSEFGGVPDVEQMHAFGVWFSYFACWNGTNMIGRSSDALINQTYNSPEVITLNEMNARRPEFLSIAATSNGTVRLEGAGPHGVDYQLITTDDLTATNGWLTVTNGTMTGGVFMTEDPQSTAEMTRFYRVLLP